MIASIGVNQRQFNLRKINDKSEKENIETQKPAEIVPFKKFFGFTVKKVKKTELIPEELKEPPPKTEVNVPPLTKLEVAG